MAASDRIYAHWLHKCHLFQDKGVTCFTKHNHLNFPSLFMLDLSRKPEGPPRSTYIAQYTLSPNGARVKFKNVRPTPSWIRSVILAQAIVTFWAQLDYQDFVLKAMLNEQQHNPIVLSACCAIPDSPPPPGGLSNVGHLCSLSLPSVLV